MTSSASSSFKSPSGHRAMFWRLWWRSISVRRPQAALAVASLLVGAAVTSALLNLYGSVRRKMNQEFQAYGPNVVVAPAPVRPGPAPASLGPHSADLSAARRRDEKPHTPTGTAHPPPQLPLLPQMPQMIGEEVLHRLESFRSHSPGLAAVPVLYVTARVEPIAENPRLEPFLNAVAVGADFAALRRLYPGWRVESVASDGGETSKSWGPGEANRPTEDSPVRMPSGLGQPRTKECVLGARLASRLRLRPGDHVQLEITSEVPGPAELLRRLRPLKPGPQRFRVAGLLSTGAQEDDQVFVSRSSVAHLAGLEGGMSLIEISVPGETQEVERVIHQLSGISPDLEIRPIRQIVDSEGKVLTTIRWLLVSLTSLILAIMALCVAATMTAIVLERRKDVAVMKALGASNLLVMELFLAEGAALGFAGSAAGYVLGSLLADALGRRLFGVALSPLSAAWWSLPAVCLLMVLMALVATAFPVRMVRGVEPARLLKGA